MKFLIKKIYIILCLLIIFTSITKVSAKDSEIRYTKENISNYFSGIISVNQDYNNEAFEHLKKVQFLKNKHSEFNIKFIRTLVLLEKFDKAFTYAKSVWSEDELLFETDLLLGLNYFLKEDYINSEKYFRRLNKISRSNFLFDNFVGNVLLAWNEAVKGNKESSLKFLERVPKPYNHIIKIQNSFLQCFFNTDDAQNSLEQLVQNKKYNFSRYNFFLANYLLFNNKTQETKKIIENSRQKYSSNLLIRQTEDFFLNKKIKKIKNFFNCKNPKDSISEFFYILANLYSSDQDYQMSNFYLKISLFLNNKFLPNKALLAENFYYQKRYKASKNVYVSIKSIGEVYSWYAAKSISTILLDTKGKEYSIKNLEKEFKDLSNPNIEHNFELANFYKDNEYYEESIKYYSSALKKLKKDHPLFSKILHRRGTSYERLGDWEKGEEDLLHSLKILPDQPHVLNYLAYTWIDKGTNLDKGLEMLKKATKLRKNDGYITDSLGWAYYAKENYIQAEKHLRRALELLPLDPIINDHYADVLWMLNRNIQARYFWSNILKLDNLDNELKDSINKKLLFGVTKKL